MNKKIICIFMFTIIATVAHAFDIELTSYESCDWWCADDIPDYYYKTVSCSFLVGLYCPPHYLTKTEAKKRITAIVNLRKEIVKKKYEVEGEGASYDYDIDVFVLRDGSIYLVELIDFDSGDFNADFVYQIDSDGKIIKEVYQSGPIKNFGTAYKIRMDLYDYFINLVEN